MRSSLILLLGCLVGLSLQRGRKCEDGSKPTCADGTEPVRVKGQRPCDEGRPKTCADGSEPTRGNGPLGRPMGPKGGRNMASIIHQMRMIIQVNVMTDPGQPVRTALSHRE